jgi:hypothetical protein
MNCRFKSFRNWDQALARSYPLVSAKSHHVSTFLVLNMQTELATWVVVRFLLRASQCFRFYCCCNRVPQIQMAKTIQIYYLIIIEVKSLKETLLDKTLGLHFFSGGPRENPVSLNFPADFFLLLESQKVSLFIYIYIMYVCTHIHTYAPYIYMHTYYTIYTSMEIYF